MKTDKLLRILGIVVIVVSVIATVFHVLYLFTSEEPVALWTTIFGVAMPLNNIVLLYVLIFMKKKPENEAETESN